MYAHKHTYNPRRVKSSDTYTIHDCAELFNVNRRTVWNWVKQGLQVIDDQKPFLIHGSALIEFIKLTQQHRKKPCQPDEFYCCKCREPRRPQVQSVHVDLLNDIKLSLRALCIACDTRLYRAGSIKNLPKYLETFPDATVANLHINDTDNPSVNCNMTGQEHANQN